MSVASARISRRQALLLAAGLACGVATLAGCGSYGSVDEAKSQNAKAPTVSGSALLADGVLRIGVNADAAPYAWVADESTGALGGFDVRVALSMADEMGLRAQFVNVGTNVSAAAQRLCDVVMGVTSNDSALADGQTTLVGSYSDAATAVFGRNVSGTVTLDQMTAGRVGVQTDSTSETVLAGVAPLYQPVKYASISAAFDALGAGEVDYVVCDSFIGGYIALGDDSIDFAGALELATSRGVGVAASNATLQSAVQGAIDAMQGDGTLETIRRSFVGDLPTVTPNNQIVAVASAAGTPAAGAAPETVAPAEGEADEVTEATLEGDVAEGDAAV